MYFNRTWRPSAARRCGAAASSAACVATRSSGSSSGTTPVPRLSGPPERGIVDGRLPEVGADVDAGDRDETEARVGQPLELVAERLAHDLVDPGHARVAAGSACCRLTRRPPARASVSSRRAARHRGRGGHEALDRRRAASCTRPSLSATTATAISARCHWSWWSTSATEMRNRWRRPSTIGRIAARLAFSDRLSGTWRSKLIAAACTGPL